MASNYQFSFTGVPDAEASLVPAEFTARSAERDPHELGMAETSCKIDSLQYDGLLLGFEAKQCNHRNVKTWLLEADSRSQQLGNEDNDVVHGSGKLLHPYHRTAPDGLDHQFWCAAAMLEVQQRPPQLAS